MENLTNYSQFVFVAYFVAGLLLLWLGAASLVKYFSLKAKIQNAK